MKNKLRPCFGSEDLIFGLHHSDAETAAKLIPELMNAGYSISALEADVRSLLTDMFNEKQQRGIDIKWNLANKHIDKQVKMVKEHYKIWLD